MKVSDLIRELQNMPQDADVWHLWDGALRTEINIVYKSKMGDVVTADYDEVCYFDEDSPIGAPLEKDNQYWCTPHKDGDDDG